MALGQLGNLYPQRSFDAERRQDSRKKAQKARDGKAKPYQVKQVRAIVKAYSL
jgi:hypothetical protein